MMPSSEAYGPYGELPAGPQRAPAAFPDTPRLLSPDLAGIVRRRSALRQANTSTDHLHGQPSISGPPRRTNLQQRPDAGEPQMLAYVVDHALRKDSSTEAATAAQLARGLGLQACI